MNGGSVETAQARGTRQTRQRQEASWEVVNAGLRTRNSLLLGLLGVALVGIIWMSLTWQKEQTLVQLVTIEHDQVVSVGPAVASQQFTPSDAQWMDMIRDWLLRVRPRNKEPVSTQVLWQQAANYTCGEAMKGLDAYEKQEQPFVELALQAKSVTVPQVAITKIADKVFQLVWEEKVTTNHTQTLHRWTGTVKVNRHTPKDTAANRLGLCVAWFNWVER